MNKILLSVLASIIISIIFTNIVTEKIERNWELKLKYEHISRALDVDYEIIKNYLNLRNDDDRYFENFLDTLNSEVSIPGRSNPCSKIRSNSSLPSVLLTYTNSGVEISLRYTDKNLIVDCESFIDTRMDYFDLKRKNHLRRLIELEVNDTLGSSQSKESVENLKKILKQRILKKDVKDNINASDITSMINSLILLDVLDTVNEKVFSDENLEALQIVKKTYRNIEYENINKNYLLLGLFIISLAIIIISLYLQKIMKKKNYIKKFFNSLIK